MIRELVITDLHAWVKNYTSQECSKCETLVKKTLSTSKHSCKCFYTLNRDHNVAIDILLCQGLITVGQMRTFALDGSNASGDVTSS
jgi:putative transposase